MVLVLIDFSGIIYFKNKIFQGQTEKLEPDKSRKNIIPTDNFAQQIPA